MADYSVKSRAKRLMAIKDVQIRTRTVEQSLLPLIEQVSALQDIVPGQHRYRRLRNVHQLILIVTKAMDNFVAVAEQVASENPDFQEELWLACEEVRNAGHNLQTAAQEYSTDTLHAPKREAMHVTAKELLLSVTRLLVLVDLIDINELLKASSRIEAKLRQLRNIDTWEGFVESIRSVTRELQTVSQLAMARQEELKSNAAQQLLVAAQTELKQCNKMLITSTMIFLEHPEDTFAQENREYVIARMQEAIKTIALLADGTDPLVIQQEQNQDSDEEDEEIELVQPTPVPSSTSASTPLTSPLPPPTASKPTPPTRPLPPPTASKPARATSPLPPPTASMPTSPTSLSPPPTASAKPTPPTSPLPPKKHHIPRQLSKNIDTFETMLEISVGSPPPTEAPRSLQAGFDLIMAAAANLAASESTRDQHGLLAQCDVVREKLQDFLSVIKTEPVDNEQPNDDSVRGEADGEDEQESPSARLHQRRTVVEEETATLRAELRRAMVDHVSDTFVDPFVPLNLMIDAAVRGDVQTVEECSAQFIIHAEKLAHVANLVCSLTSDNAGSRLVRLATRQMTSLKQQVSCAAKTLAAHPDSEAAQKNMNAFKEAWVDKVTLLTDSLDAVVPLQDFIAVTEAHVREDSRRLMEALEGGDLTVASDCAKVIQGRCQRMIQVVQSDIGNNPTRYAHEDVHKIEQHMTKLQDKTLVSFQKKFVSACTKMNTRHFDSELRKLEDHIQLVNDGVRDIRKCVLKTRTKAELEAEPDAEDIMSPATMTAFPSDEDMLINQPIKVPSPILARHGGSSPMYIEIEEITLTPEQYASMMTGSSQGGSIPLAGIVEEDEEEEDEEKEEEKKEEEQEKINEKHEDKKEKKEAALPEKTDEEYYTTNTMRRRLIKRTPSVAVINEHETAQAIMAQLPAHERARIAKVNEKLNKEKKKLESEVNQWDDSSNDIVLLAKEMCWMMMDMSDFTRGLGPLKTTVDLSNTAKDIARAGQYLDKLVKQVADQCPDESCRKDLQAYMERMQLSCHQLKITSAVTADLGTSIKETVDTASNLIIAAKNLMNTVVQVVKSCYVASVAIERKQGSKSKHFLQWQLMTPKKKNLYSHESLNTLGMYRETPRHSISPIKELGDFKGRSYSSSPPET